MECNVTLESHDPQLMWFLLEVFRAFTPWLDMLYYYRYLSMTFACTYVCCNAHRILLKLAHNTHRISWHNNYIVSMKSIHDSWADSAIHSTSGRKLQWLPVASENADTSHVSKVLESLSYILVWCFIPKNANLIMLNYTFCHAPAYVKGETHLVEIISSDAKFCHNLKVLSFKRFSLIS